jgi:hypothetical protein
MNSRLYRLTELHQRIDQALQLEQSRRFPNPFQLMRLKARKVRVKQRLFPDSFKLRSA